MRLALTPLALALVVLPVLGAQQAPPPPRRLFDGHSLAGWSGDPRYWSVEDGAIVGRSSTDRPLAHNTYLIHDAVAGDFELRFRFHVVGGNSGVQYRSQVVGPFAVAGYQADLEAGPSFTGILYETDGRAILATRGEQVRLLADGTRESERFADAAELQRAIREDDWNHYRVHALENRIVHEINGVRMVDVIDDEPRAARSGRIALQLHGGAPMTVRFADMELTHLGPEPRREAEWIWTTPRPARDEIGRLRAAFHLADLPARARVLVTADDRFTMWVNGAEAATGEDWGRPAVAFVEELLRPGVNVLAIEAVNGAGPAAVALRLELDDGGDAPRTIATDRSWRTVPADAGNDWRDTAEDPRWAGAHSFGVVGADTGPWGDVFAEEQATPASALAVPPGYRAELIASARLGEGSWIALAFDRDGSPLVGREGMPIARIVLGSRAPVVETLDGTPRTAMGICRTADALYAQGEGPDGNGLWRHRDTDGDGRYESHERLAAFGGSGEHGAHAVVPGPDGALWLMNGNMASLPTTVAPGSPLAHQAEDVLLPRIEDPRGHAVGVRVPAGHVLRVDEDGRRFELFAGGLRNPYDIAFSPDGDAFVVDADMEWDIGLPWYRPPRVLHVVSGSEWGWRSGSAKWPTNSPDSLPSVVDLDLSSPTGATFGTDLRFPAADRRALFVGDWAQGRILAIRLEPRGASWQGSAETFVSGKPLNVTDLAAGPDGALWFVTGGRGTQSGLYRLAFPGTDPGAISARDEDAIAARAQRRLLESFHRREDPSAIDVAWRSLGDPDPFLHHAARVALERQPVRYWRDPALGETSPARGLTALLALVRVGDDGDRTRALEALARFPWADLDESARRTWLRIHTVALARGADGVALREPLLRRLDPLFPSGDDALDRTLLELLVHLDDGRVVERALARIERMDVAPAIALAHSLRLLDGDWTTSGRERLFAWIARAKERAHHGGLSFRGYLERIADEALARAPEAERAGLRALADGPPTPVVETTVPGGPHDWKLAELLPHLDRVAGPGRSFENGRSAFTRAACVACHRVAGLGGDVGPDLTAAASRFSRRDLLRAILEPSTDVSDQYADVELTLTDGKTLVGRIVAETTTDVDLVVDAVSGGRRRVPLTTIVSRRTAAISPMPSGLLSALALEDVLDLIAWLESGGDPTSPAFRTGR